MARVVSPQGATEQERLHAIMEATGVDETRARAMLARSEGRVVGDIKEPMPRPISAPAWQVFQVEDRPHRTRDSDPLNDLVGIVGLGNGVTVWIAESKAHTDWERDEAAFRNPAATIMWFISSHSPTRRQHTRSRGLRYSEAVAASGDVPVTARYLLRTP
jgi:hypothetical protein